MVAVDLAAGAGLLPWLAAVLAVGVVIGVVWLRAQERNR
jgi:hypothetical protein